MDQRIQTFLQYVLEKDAVSEAFFKSEFKSHSQLFVVGNLNIFSNTIQRLLERWTKQFSSDDESTVDVVSCDSSKSSSDEDELQVRKTLVHEVDDLAKINRQCEILLQLLYQLKKQFKPFLDLYFQTLLNLIKTNIDELVAVAVQQIAVHLNENADGIEKSHFRQYFLQIKSNRYIHVFYGSLLAEISVQLSADPMANNQNQLSMKKLSTMYPYSAYYLDVRREFRDSVEYFLDGDSLMLYVAHHTNVDLMKSFGNTLHVVYIIEQILQGLFNQSSRFNFTILFFDCHYQIYQGETPILDLIRTCLIAHLSKNATKYGQIKFRIFSSWVDKEYRQFYNEKRPMFIFYHSMSNMKTGGDQLLLPMTLEKLCVSYYLFGNYHQFVLNINVYLMNKLSLTSMSLECFRISFKQEISISMINATIRESAFVKSEINQLKYQTQYETFCREIQCNDVRLVIYLKAIRELLADKRIKADEVDLVRFCIPFFLLHVSLLIRLSLIDRHLSSTAVSITTSPSLSLIISKFQQALRQCLICETSSLSWTHVADLFDGRLFAFTFQWMNQSTRDPCFHFDTIEIVSKSLKKLGIGTGIDDLKNGFNEMIRLKHIQFSSSLSNDSLPTKRSQVIQITNPLVEIYLKPISSVIVDHCQFDFISPEQCQSTAYKGKYHWHTLKEVGDEISRIRNDNDSMANVEYRRYRTRKQQIFYKYFTLYGRSLTSRDVKNDQLQITAAALPSTIESETKSATPVDEKKTKKKDRIHVKKADLIIAQNKQRKLDKTTNVEAEKLKSINEQLDALPDGSWLDTIELIDQYLPQFVTPIHRTELLKKKFRQQRKYIQILKNVHNPSNEQKSTLKTLQIGCFATMTQLVELDPVRDPFVEKRKYMEELMDDSVLDNEKWYRFQMEKINSCLPRCDKGSPDARVPDFTPDQWQVKFLDAVDHRQTIVIVAPTASGKTYASYYAMQKVLTNKDVSDGICVYVAPTKALVNQVAATVYSKFGPVFGIFTRDYRVNMDTCQILVTVPQCFEILLLSSSYQHWCKKIQYAIFDEIHCMSGEIASDVWERAMLLINCPMIGLSATVNNGEDLCSWLRQLEEKRASLFRTRRRQVCLIVHHERSADLNKYVYANRELHRIHPIGFINSKELEKRNLPTDFSLSPLETIQLRDAIETAVGKNEKLFPSLTDYFSPAWVIDRNRCKDYCDLIYKKFNQLIIDQNYEKIDQIGKSLDTITSQRIKYPESTNRTSLIVDFVLTLKEKDLLPCIVFADDRRLCETMARAVATHFERLESYLRQTKYQRDIAAIHEKLDQQEKAEKSIVKMAKKLEKSASKRRDDAGDAAEKQMMINDMVSSTQLSGRERELLIGILPEGTLANRRSCDRELVEEFLERTEYSNGSIVEMMKRGVAYHHAGLNNKNRIAVEALFRNRYIQIVFSTSTLALGIHMPTKTVAFLSDSIYLDALQYRQSSGRAGRRGFDIEGHVVFLDIPVRKIRHLIMSNIPDIKPHFPLTVTFLMRLFHLYFHGSDRDDAFNRSLIALEHPFMLHFPSIHSDLLDTQMRFYVLHTLDLLHQLNMINEHGDLVGLAGLATHLHYFQPANIVLIYLIQSKLFHRLTNDEEIVAVLAYLFTKLPWLKRESEIAKLQTERKAKKYNSHLFLPRISLEFRQQIDAYNSKVKEVYSVYIENVTRRMRLLDHSAGTCLPLSGISFAHSTDYDDGTFEYQLHHHYSQQSRNPSISPFAGLSGLSHEKFISNYHSNTTSWDLVSNLNLSERVIPYLDIDCRDHTNATYLLNSYVLDFYRIGSERLLEEENELHAGDIYNCLLDFQLVLSSIKTSLETIIKNDIKQKMELDFFEPLYETIQRIHENFSDKFYRVYPRHNRI